MKCGFILHQFERSRKAAIVSEGVLCLGFSNNAESESCHETEHIYMQHISTTVLVGLSWLFFSILCFVRLEARLRPCLGPSCLVRLESLESLRAAVRRSDTRSRRSTEDLRTRREMDEHAQPWNCQIQTLKHTKNR